MSEEMSTRDLISAITTKHIVTKTGDIILMKFPEEMRHERDTVLENSLRFRLDLDRLGLTNVAVWVGFGDEDFSILDDAKLAELGLARINKEVKK